MDNVEFVADRFYNGGETQTVSTQISGVDEGTLYQSERYGTYDYNIPVTSATYTVELHFVEMYHESTGSRSFDVSVEGQNALDNLDIYSFVGANTAFSYRLDNVPVSDGKLTISLSTVVDNATLSGIAVYSADGGQFDDQQSGEECNPADMTPAPTVISRQNDGVPPSGAYSVTIEHDSTLQNHTIYRPDLSNLDSIPIVAWGNGACSANGLEQAEFLSEITSHGYLVIANGAPNGSGSDDDHGQALIDAIDWAEAENSRACSPYYGKLNVNKIATMGWSCGGMMAHYAAVDPRVTTTVALNSGIFNDDRMSYYQRMHAPVAIFNGDESDVAYDNGLRAFDEITTVPVYHANYPQGHGDAYFQDNGGEFGIVAVGWLDWMLKGDQSASGKGMFIGQNCRLCRSPWISKNKGFDNQPPQSSSSSSSSSSASTGSNSITVRMSGVVGDESVSLEIGGSIIKTWTVSTSMQDYTVSTDAEGELRVAFTNDEGDRDVQVDYVSVNGTVFQAEDQADNTGAYDETCGGGSYSEMLHCDGSIGFGNPWNPTSSSSASSTSSSSGGKEFPPFFVGNITTRGSVRSDFTQYWNQITPENEGKWGSVEGNRDSYNWGPVDRIYQFARQNDIPVKAHTLVWGSQQPNWIDGLSASEQRAEIEEWIRDYCTRYPDTAMIDVVNEAVQGHAPANYARNAFGNDWITESFRLARQYCPNSILIYNDYNFMTWNTDEIMSLIRPAVQAGVVDAVGLQAHSLYDPKVWSAREIEDKLDLISTLGVPIYISEYDIEATNDQTQLQYMQMHFPTFYNHPNVKGITLWGYIYGATWRTGTGLIQENGQHRPAMDWLMNYLGR